jgi:hypothetical protein
MDAEEDGEHEIEMDAAADAAARQSERLPAFYYAEQSQQTIFVCRDCGHWNDILGKFGYCSSCGTRNDVEVVESLVRATREKINASVEADLGTAVRDLVSAFDTMTQQLVDQLVRLVPLSRRRQNKLKERSYHNPASVAEDLEAAFDFDMLTGIDESTRRFVGLMFARRHVYEHNGGEVDEAYLKATGDSSVRLKQLLRETREDVHRLAGLIVRMARNLDRGFHELLPPEQAPIVRKIKLDELRRSRSGR